MDNVTPDKPLKPLPFNNLYLNSGVVHGYNSGWMYLLTVVFAMTGYFFSQSLMFIPLLQRLKSKGYTSEAILEKPSLVFDSKALAVDPNIVLLLMMLMFVGAFCGLYLGLRFLHKKSLLSVFTGYERFRYKRFFFSFFIWSVLVLLFMIVSYLLSPGDYTVTFEPRGLIVSAIILIVLLPVQTGFEELLFRGYLVQGLSQLFGNGLLPLLCCSLLFGMAHMTNPEVAKHGWPLMLPYYTLFALFLGGITLLDEGLELAFGIHLANNLVSSIVVSTSNGALKTYSILQTDVESPLLELIAWCIMACITFFIFRHKYRWRNYRLIIN